MRSNWAPTTESPTAATNEEYVQYVSQAVSDNTLKFRFYDRHADNYIAQLLSIPVELLIKNSLRNQSKIIYSVKIDQASLVKLIESLPDQEKLPEESRLYSISRDNVLTLESTFFNKNKSH